MIFRRATLRLTLTYAAVQLGLFAIFALGIYFFVTGNFDVDAVSKKGEEADPEVILLRNGLIIFYGCLMLVVPLSSWLMARAALRPIRESFERQRAFIDGAAHEMRTPLSIIQGELELALSRSRRAEEYREAIRTALGATVRLSNLSDQLLNLSRISKSELVAGFVAVDIDAVIDTVIHTAVLGSRDVTVEREGSRRQSDLVHGSQELLVRAIANVVDNAVKFSSPGGLVVVTCARDVPGVSIRVRDEGMGMSPTEVDRAFDRFWRADTARSTAGHGLGLALVQQIVAAHDGSVTIDSHPGAGTTVTVRLPVPRP